MAIDPRGINRDARGFLDLMLAKVGGKQPRSFGPDVLPMVDMQPYLGATLLRSRSDEDLNAGSGAIASITVPSDETWLIHRIAGGIWDSALSVGQVTRGDLSITSLPISGSSSSTYRIGQVGINDVDGNMESQIFWEPGSPFLLPPNAALRSEIVSTTHTSNHYVSVLYSVLQI